MQCQGSNLVWKVSETAFKKKKNNRLGHFFFEKISWVFLFKKKRGFLPFQLRAIFKRHPERKKVGSVFWIASWENKSSKGKFDLTSSAICLYHRSRKNLRAQLATSWIKREKCPECWIHWEVQSGQQKSWPTEGPRGQRKNVSPFSYNLR